MKDKKSFFVFKLFISSFIAILLGRCVEKIVEFAQNSKTDKVSALLALLLQIGIIIGILWLGSSYLIRKFNFDSWLFDTFDGYVFSLMFAATQQSLSNNVKILF